MADRELVIVGMSGGVDSSVAGALLLDQGFEVQGLFMSNWQEDEDGYCTSAQDFDDTRRVCEMLGIALHRTDFSREYRGRVFQHFLDEYAARRTPNPDVLCNREIKFGVCFEHARRLGADRFATGHYARLDFEPRLRLRKAVDLAKDQSYFLHAAPPHALARSLFPLGELKKAEVRRIARERGLPVHDKCDSTGICFIGERPFAQFLGRYLPAQPGAIESPNGTRLGSHRGLMFYTLGQRKGLGIGGQRRGAEAPWYVIDKDLDRNVLIVGQGHDHPGLYSTELVAEEFAWLADPPDGVIACHAKTRYRQPDQRCTVHPLGGDRIRIEFDEPQRAVTPGQYVVLYGGDECLGGGVISRAGTSPPSDQRREAPGAAAYPARAEPV